MSDSESGKANWWDEPMPKDDVQLWRESLKGASPVISSLSGGLTLPAGTETKKTESAPCAEPRGGSTASEETETENGF